MSAFESNSVINRIQELLAEREWSVYRLAKEADIPYSSLNNIFVRNNYPTIATLERICSGLGITMSEFFKDNTCPAKSDVYTAKEKDIIVTYRQLDNDDKKLFHAYLDGLAKRLSQI